MPTEIREDGFEIVLNTDDHAPPHVHAYKGGTTCRIAIGRPGETPPAHYPWKKPRKTTMRARDIVRAIELVGAHQDALLAKWEEIHGPLER